MTGRISAFQSLGTVDGPGVRAVVFASGCPLRCGYCHNPETWSERGTEVSEDELLAKILRLKPYIRHGGVTFSGGEPLLQAEFFASLARSLKAEGLHVALDTSGNGGDAHVGELLDAVDLVLLDVKFSNEKDYRAYTGGSFARTMDFLADVRSRGKRVWIRRVIVAGLNDGEEDVRALKDLLAPFSDVIDRVEFLPFRKLCLEKYERLGLPFPFGSYDETPSSVTDRLTALYESL